MELLLLFHKNKNWTISKSRTLERASTHPAQKRLDVVFVLLIRCQCRKRHVKGYVVSVSAGMIPPPRMNHLPVQNPVLAMPSFSTHPIQTNPTQPNPTQPNPIQPNPTQPNPTQPNPTQPLNEPTSQISHG
jgi:hypothetical protein